MKPVAVRKLTASLNELSATEIVRLVSAGETTCEGVVRACLERIGQREPEVGAWHYLNPEQVIAKAREIDKSGRRGPLIGVPFGIKDIIDSCDMPTEYGSPIYRGHQPRNDATCIALSRKAGGILMGKTVSTEFANQYPGKTRNPFDPTRTPGGSSSGSAAAVGAGVLPVGLGTQVIGSTLRPASFCGCYGFKPTVGALNRGGSYDGLSQSATGMIAASLPEAWQ